MLRTMANIPGPIGRSIRRVHLRSCGLTKAETNKQIEWENSKAYKISMAQFKNWDK